MNDMSVTKKDKHLISNRKIYVFGAAAIAIFAEIVCVLAFIRMQRSHDQDSFMLACVALFLLISWPWLGIRRLETLDSSEEANRNSAKPVADNFLISLLLSYMALLFALTILLRHVKLDV